MNDLSQSVWQYDSAQNSYRYLLIDPLCTLHGSDSFHLDNLIERFSAQRVVPVLRQDLAYQQTYCPHLIELASPEQTCDEILLKRSVTQAYRERFRRKRVICGWISSQQSIIPLAQHIGSLCSTIGNELNPSCVLPFFEPIRFELLSQTDRISAQWLSTQLYPINSWIVVTVGGELLKENGKKSDHQESYLSLKARRAQQNLPLIIGLLSAWQRLADKKKAALPKDSALQALTQIIAAHEKGLTDKQDIYSFGLNALAAFLPENEQNPSSERG